MISFVEWIKEIWNSFKVYFELHVIRYKNWFNEDLTIRNFAIEIIFNFISHET